MDWIRLGNSGKDLTGVGGRVKSVSPQELAAHNTQSLYFITFSGIFNGYKSISDNVMRSFSRILNVLKRAFGVLHVKYHFCFHNGICATKIFLIKICVVSDDAWLAIRGRVYNITHYLPYHPGGKNYSK
jgi:hypothetical protein